MHMDAAVIPFVTICFIVFTLGFLAKKMRAPIMVGYMIAGFVVGPSGLGIITDQVVPNQLGSFGVLLLLFFVGMELSIADFKSNLVKATVGTLLQIGLSIAFTFLIGFAFDWPWQRALVMGFVISLSSTAVVFRFLQNENMLQSKIGGAVGNILISQDFAVIAMLLCVQYLGPKQAGADSHAVLQLIGCILFCGVLFLILKKQHINLGIWRWVEQDKELQVFLALLLCFGIALIAGLFHLSAALGAFVGGIIVSAARETEWVSHRLETFQILLMAVFFAAVGMMLDVSVLREYWLTIGLLLLAVFLTNTFINTGILMVSGFNFRDSLFGGSLLSQIGEFSFVLAAISVQIGIISQITYQITLSVIAMSLFFSPIWVFVVTKLFPRTPEVHSGESQPTA
ncbi:cation:proton antiporter [Acanthopleuribacter pedis]|uniref:Cation:proton antiporter n=1 Tax=Acanthopleuribacter pedis TaxID=442870 RepID=A0A8J7QA68_9BACT|nr:cation:proton antiporter [Acanthopleuribacter pedis]MBO1320595.1 cation:proton antiporter [Acanthopleuribacter pedis]